MRIDCPDPAGDPGTLDAPDTPRSPGRTPPADGQPRLSRQSLADPAEREAVHRTYQEVVWRHDNPWIRARPGLQADWHDIESRYPDQDRPTPQNHPDGSWSCGDTRKLTPDQNAEVSRGYERIRETGERDIAPAMRAIEATDPDRHLAGFEKRIKGLDRLKEKVADLLAPPSDVAPPQALAAVADVVRFTYVYPDTGYAQGVQTDVERLKGKGFDLSKLKNTWTSDQYKGINSQWQEPISGVRFEVQFHTQASLEAKELSHKAYERLRGDHAQDDEREELEAFQSKVNAKVPIPPEASTIEDHPREKHDG